MEFLDPNVRREIEKNIFQAAHSAIGDWNSYNWHWAGMQVTAGRQNSSQALSIDVFGTIKAIQNGCARDAVMNALAIELGMQPDQEWDIELEWTDDQNLLNEPRKSQIDVKAKSRNNLLLIECKFTEKDGGSCSQLIPRGGNRQCSGAYKKQTNPINGREAKCALAAKGIRYWDIIPEVFNIGKNSEYEKCPFRDGWFQFMRNLVLCHKLAEGGLKSKVVIVYVDKPNMPFKKRLECDDWTDFRGSLKSDAVLRTISYERIIELGTQALQRFQAERKIWQSLKKHVEAKVTWVSDQLG